MMRKKQTIPRFVLGLAAVLALTAGVATAQPSEDPMSSFAVLYNERHRLVADRVLHRLRA